MWRSRARSSAPGDPPGDRRGGTDKAGLAHASMPCQGHTRTLCGRHLRPALCASDARLCVCRALSKEKEACTDCGRRIMAALFPVWPGPGGGAGQGRWEGAQREEERARGLLLEGSQSAEAEEFREQSTPHGGSNLRLGSRLQLARMGPAGTWDLLVPGQGKEGPGWGPRLHPRALRSDPSSWFPGLPCWLLTVFLRAKVLSPGQKACAPGSNQNGREGKTEQLF